MAEPTCSTVQEQLVDWLEGRLAPAEAEAIRSHLETCSSCGRELDAWRPAVQALTSAWTQPGRVQDTPDARLTADLAARIQAVVRAESQRVRHVRRGVRLRSAAGAALHTLVLGGVLAGTAVGLAQAGVWSAIAAHAASVTPAILWSALGLAVTFAIGEVQRGFDSKG